ncbi:MAG: hypothetical protein GY830_01320 [Bacteroidetes bacterium]|nr:hypothetical protein [Bacteroidota bacterium]
MNKSFRDNYLQNSLHSGELNPVSRVSGGETHHYNTEDLMLEQKSKAFASALQRKMIAVKVFFKKSSPVKAKVITLPHDTQISTQIMKDK